MLNKIDITDAKELEKWVVPITKARRDFGRVVDRVEKTGRSVVLTKGGRPVAKVVPMETESRKIDKSKERNKDWLSKYVGAWEGSDLVKDEFWNEILTRDSKPIVKL